MAAFWPAELPTGLLAGTDVMTYENNQIVSTMDTGPSKVRRRTTAAPIELSGTLPPLSETQKRIFDQFWRSTLRSGTLPFYLSGTLMRFKPGVPPRATNLKVAAYAAFPNRPIMYNVSITIEILP